MNEPTLSKGDQIAAIMQVKMQAIEECARVLNSLGGAMQRLAALVSDSVKVGDLEQAALLSSENNRLAVEGLIVLTQIGRLYAESVQEQFAVIRNPQLREAVAPLLRETSTALASTVARATEAETRLRQVAQLRPVPVRLA